ncbi:hypothetical protein [Deinococcus sp.]|uniref:hypothetical protein n=1 Tax=Deinococcus sp. TaxID=47478 RepID=UPI003C7C1A9B
MTRPPTRCESRFRAAAPSQLYEVVWRYLNTLYPAEFRKVMNGYSVEAARTLLPHQRRARMESDLPNLMFELGLKITVEQFPNTTDTFILIHLTDQVKLIVCYANNKTQAVRYAKARADLTAESNQPYLIPPTDERTVLTPETLFAILAHSAAENDMGRFGSAVFQFPPPDGIANLGELKLSDEMERAQRQAAEEASLEERVVEIKIKKGG